MSSSSPISPGEPKPALTSGPRVSSAPSDEPTTAIVISTNSAAANIGPNAPTSPLASGRSGSSEPPT